MKELVTIKDIARALNISVSTVSRALSGSNLVKPETKSAVSEMAKQLNYQPNLTAISLKSNRTYTLGLIVPQIVHDFFSSVIRGIEDMAATKGYHVIICSSHEEYEKEVSSAMALLKSRVDGLIACTSKNSIQFDHFLEYKNRDIPLVFFDSVVEAIDTDKVVIDDKMAAYQAVDFLIKKGRKKIAFVGGPISAGVSKKRYEGYKQCLIDHKMEINADWLIDLENSDYDESLLKTKNLFSTPNYPDAVFASADMVAIGAIKNIIKSGKSIPNEVMVVGFSNWQISSILEPTLTTVNQPAYEMGQIAVEKLIRQIESKEPIEFETIILQTQLIERETTT